MGVRHAWPSLGRLHPPGWVPGSTKPAASGSAYAFSQAATIWNHACKQGQAFSTCRGQAQNTYLTLTCPGEKVYVLPVKPRRAREIQVVSVCVQVNSLLATKATCRCKQATCQAFTAIEPLAGHKSHQQRRKGHVRIFVTMTLGNSKYSCNSKHSCHLLHSS